MFFEIRQLFPTCWLVVAPSVLMFLTFFHYFMGIFKLKVMGFVIHSQLFPFPLLALSRAYNLHTVKLEHNILDNIHQLSSAIIANMLFNCTLYHIGPKLNRLLAEKWSKSTALVTHFLRTCTVFSRRLRNKSS